MFTNDLETLTKMFRKSNIDFKTNVSRREEKVETGEVRELEARYEDGRKETISWPITITKISEETTLVIEAGYIGFFTNFNFDSCGNLKSVEAFE